MEEFDSIIIGAGQAGPSLAASLAGKGERVALLERELPGGTCVNTGCTPTKTMVASARAIWMAGQGKTYGFDVEGQIRANMKRIRERKDRVVKESREGLISWMENTEGVSLIYGHARFADNQHIEVNGKLMKGGKFFINTGGRPKMLEDADTIPYLTNQSVMDLDRLPGHLVIVGGSYIGLEFGQMFRRFGAKVTIVEKGDRLVHQEDSEASTVIRNFLEREGVAFRLEAECIKTTRNDNIFQVQVNCADGPPKIDASHVLLAIGRVPNTDDLGLANTSVKTDARGYIYVDDTLKTTTPHIWALGDCNGNAAFTHAAYNDYQIVFDQLYGSGERRVSKRISCYSLYTDPPLARIGINRREATERKMLMARRTMDNVARAKEKGETDGYMEVYIDPDSERIAGATLLGTGCDEVIHSLLDMMYAGASYKVVRDAVHIHPTVSELIPTMLESLEPLG